MALTYLQRGLDAAHEAGARHEVVRCHAELAEVYKKLGDTTSALDHFENFYRAERLLFDQESDRRLKTIEIIHNVENTRKDAEIYQLRNVQLQREVEERKQAQAALERLATIDTLTGLANRRYFLELAERAFYQAQRYNRPLSVVMIDVDNFKHINDTFGHAAGDQVLASLASRMQQVLRRSDILGRYGGDEFAVVLPETGQEGARRMTERLRAAVAHTNQMLSTVDVPVSLSVGVSSSFGLTNVTLDQLLQRADKALYTSKQSGRDRVTAFDAPQPRRGRVLAKFASPSWGMPVPHLASLHGVPISWNRVLHLSVQLSVPARIICPTSLQPDTQLFSKNWLVWCGLPALEM